MNYKVLLVEDEKAARVFFLAVLDGETKGLTSLEPAVNGLEGWEKIKEEPPDILVTDIRMPVMDGLELVSRVRKDYPRIMTLVLSGYQEFEYARQAFTNGVEDYLLKPLNIDQFRDVMNRAREKLVYRDNREQLASIRKISEEGFSGKAIALNGNRQIRLGMIREGGLIVRFTGVSRSGADLCDGSILVFEGRDRKENFYLADANHVSRDDFIFYLKNTPSINQEIYRTICLYPEQFPLKDLRNALEYVRKRIDRNITLGQSQILNDGNGETIPRSGWNESQIQSIEYLLINRKYGGIRQLLKERLTAWEREGCPLILLESSLKEFLIILKRQGNAIGSDAAEEEILLELYLSESRHYGELSEHLWSLVRSMLGLGESSLNEKDLPEIFRGLCIYLENHFGENLRLSEVSGYFNLSPSYISRLFSRHFHCSFSDYVKRRRMKGARELMRLNPDMPVQDVARYCGYDDPFYFSKVFKQESGLSPSQFKRNGEIPE